MALESLDKSTIIGFLWDIGTLALVTPLAGWSLMKLADGLEKAKKTQRKVNIWAAYCAIAFVILFFLKFPLRHC